ncbi:Hypothetical predicted protein [Lecanosticta acicola]|uniref:BTB domain-containing protein n=1 Tax=Lecanosticta acicola TaxID=111012 RepID=A0AAI9EA21_9PEZI|nr:Hypothetical predicted protein [Lecanosticta acicola]
MAQGAEKRTAPDVGADAEQHYKKLKTGQVVEILIGQEVDPVFVSEDTLRKASRYFTNELNTANQSGIQVTLEFPNDDLEAWKIMLYWIEHQKLPEITYEWVGESQETKNTRTLCRCWLVGEKYLVPTFQNAIMNALLYAFNFKSVALDTVKEVFCNTRPQMPLRRVIAEELVYATHIGKIHGDELFALDGVIGLGKSLIDAKDKHAQTSRLRGARLDEGTLLWKEYMVEED